MTPQEIFLERLGTCNCRCEQGICQNFRVPNLENVAYLSYRDFDADGNQSGEFKRVFDLTKSPVFKQMDNNRDFPLAAIRHAYEMNDGDNNVSGSGALMGIQKLYRLCPVAWNSLRYLLLPSIRKQGTGRVGFAEHKFIQLATDEDVTDTPRYNRILLDNLKFGFLMRMMHLTSEMTGFYRNPLIKQPAATWTNSWDFLKNSSASLPDWLRMIGLEANNDVDAYFCYMKTCITTYARDMKLEDSEFWRRNGEENILIDHLYNWQSLTAASYNLLSMAFKNLWFHFIRCQTDLALLCSQVIEK